MKLKKWILIIGLIIFDICFIVIYRYNSFIPKKINVSVGKDIVEIEDCIAYEEISNDEIVIKCVLDEKYIQEIPFYNYVLGYDLGKKIDFSIVVKKEDEYLKAKTLLRDENYNEDSVTLYAYIKNKYLSEEIFLYDNNNEKLYRVKGEI